jgi:hypothetical protein
MTPRPGQALSAPEYWSVPRAWAGKAAFIVGGGASVLRVDPEALRRRNVIVINSSYQRFPTAGYLIFSDSRWWEINRDALSMEQFRGVVVSAALGVEDKHIVIVKRKSPPGLATERDTLAIKNTTLTAAINLAVHLGADRIGLLGIDGKDSPDGRTHHHEPHPWERIPGCYDEHGRELMTLVHPLMDLGVKVVNLNPYSAHRMFPFKKFDDILKEWA